MNLDAPTATADPPLFDAAHYHWTAGLSSDDRRMWETAIVATGRALTDASQAVSEAEHVFCRELGRYGALALCGSDDEARAEMALWNSEPWRPRLLAQLDEDEAANSWSVKLRAWIWVPPLRRWEPVAETGELSHSQTPASAAWWPERAGRSAAD